MFTTQKLIFASLFLLVFIVGMAWSYRKDLSSTKIHFKGAYKVLIFIILVLVLLIFIVKMRHKIH